MVFSYVRTKGVADSSEEISEMLLPMNVYDGNVIGILYRGIA